jgi:hypothetical protein
MAKHLTIEIQLQDDDDIYSDVVQDGMVQAIMTFEGVQDAKVVGVSESAADPGAVPQSDDIATKHDPDGGEPIPVES